MLLKEIKNIFHKELDGLYPQEEVTSFFYMLIEHYLGLERFILALDPNISITKEDESPLFEALSRLKLEVPVQHIIGKTHFMDLDFIVDKNVLIPRPETEELVRWILEDIKDKATSIRILDIGTGTGCIPIALKKHLPNAEVSTVDVSDNALKIAMQNAKENNVQIDFIHADILAIDKLGAKYDIIVSNPPYVRELEKKAMKANVLEHEPSLALFVSDQDPLLFYRKITEFAAHNLNNDGALYFEINQYLGKETQHILEKNNFSDIELRKDIFGNDRMLKGINQY